MRKQFQYLLMLMCSLIAYPHTYANDLTLHDAEAVALDYIKASSLRDYEGIYNLTHPYTVEQSNTTILNILNSASEKGELKKYLKMMGLDGDVSTLKNMGEKELFLTSIKGLRSTIPKKPPDEINDIEIFLQRGQLENNSKASVFIHVVFSETAAEYTVTLEPHDNKWKVTHIDGILR